MAVRTTAAKVKEILDTELANSVIDAYILGASYTVDQVFSGESTLTAAHLAEIERWLAAHMIAVTREQQIERAGAGGASIQFQGVTGKGLEASLYGQQVLVLDTTGKLAKALYGKSANMIAVTSFS